MASEGEEEVRSEEGDPAKTTGEEEVRSEEGDPAKTTDEKEAQTEEDDLAKTTDEEEARAEETDPAKTSDEEEVRTEEDDSAKTSDEEEARTEEDDAKKETIERTLDFDPFEFDYTSEGIWSPKEDSITNNPGSDQTVNRGSTSIPPIGSPPVVASLHNNSNQSFGTQQQQRLSPRMVTTRPRSQAAHNSAAASFVPNNAPRRPNQITRPMVQEPAFVDHNNYARGMPQQHYHPNAEARMMYQQHRVQAPMWLMLYNPQLNRLVPYILSDHHMRWMMYHPQLNRLVPYILSDHQMRSIMFNQPQEQIVPSIFPGQAPVMPMVYNNQHQQLNQGGQHFGVPNNAAAPMMLQQHQNLVRGQAPVRLMVYNNQQLQFNQGQHFGFPNNAAAPRPELDQEMQQLQLQMQQPAASQGYNSGPSSGESQD